MDINSISSRNQEEKFTYFLVRSNSDRIKSLLPLQEYKMYVFTNPVTASRGTKILTDAYTMEIIPITDLDYPTGSLSHPKYTNQKNMPLQFLYKDIEQKIIPVTASRTETI